VAAGEGFESHVFAKARRAGRDKPYWCLGSHCGCELSDGRGVESGVVQLVFEVPKAE
jgi:hypothetical protein